MHITIIIELVDSKIFLSYTSFIAGSAQNVAIVSAK